MTYVTIHISTVADTLPPDVVTAAQERGKALDLRDTVTKLALLFEGESLISDQDMILSSANLKSCGR